MGAIFLVDEVSRLSTVSARQLAAGKWMQGAASVALAVTSKDGDFFFSDSFRNGTQLNLLG